MPASLRMEIFPADQQRTIEFYTKVLRFKLLRHEDSYTFFQRDSIFIGADASHPADTLAVNADYRRPPTGIEAVIEVDDLDAERDYIVAQGYTLDADIKFQFWNLRDFRVVDPDGYYLRITEHSRNRMGKGPEDAS